MQARGELRSLTGLRGIAALLVVLHHMPPTSSLPWLMAATDHWYLCVDVFFVLSGFVMAYVHHADPPGWRSYGRFLLARFARVYPLYFVCTSGLILLGVVGASHQAVSRSAVGLASNLLLIQSWGIGWSIDFPAWSISAELAAYLAFPVLLALARSRAAAGACIAALACVFVLTEMSSATLAEDVVGRAGALDVWNGETPAPVLRCVAEFLLGLATWRALQTPRIERVARSGALCAALAAAVMVLGCRPGRDIVVVALLPPLIACLAAGSSWPCRALAWGPVRQLGVWSYALYLTHRFLVPGREHLQAVLHAAHLPMTEVLSWSVLLPCMIALAAVAHWAVERPAQRRFRARRARRDWTTLPGPVARPSGPA